MQIGNEKEKEKSDKLTELFSAFFHCEKVFQFGVQFQLDYKTKLNSASKPRANKLNTNVS